MYCSLMKGLLRVVPQRYVMTLLGFLLTVIGCTMKYAIGIAITEMVVPHQRELNATVDPEACPYPEAVHAGSNFTISEDVVERFDWSEKTQGIIFGSLYWVYMPAQIPIGSVIERVGVRHILGVGMFLSSLCYIFTPMAVLNLGAPGFVLTRLLMGVFLAPLFPSVGVILAKWAPPAEKSKLGAIIFAGENIGFIFSMAMSGVILGAAQGNWPLLFYVYGGLGLVWCALWALFGYNDIDSHPFLSSKERDYLAICLAANNLEKKLPPTPWREMVKSPPLWGLVITQIGHDWGLITLITELPKYMKMVLHYDIEANGLLTAIGYVIMTFVAIGSGWLSDWLHINRYCSITTVRKIFTTIEMIGPAVFIVAAMYAGCNRTLVVGCFALGVALMGCHYSSLAVNPLDLSPNYSGTLMGLIALGGVGGIVSPYLSGVLAPQGTMSQWRSVFWVAVGIWVVTDLLYLCVGSGKVQHWNSPQTTIVHKTTTKSKNTERRCSEKEEA